MQKTDSEPWAFADFMNAASERLLPVKAKLMQREEDDEGTSWWFTFSRASSNYRVSFDRHTSKLLLEKSQGSFVPNSLPTWRVLESRSHSDPAFETILAEIADMLTRFQ